MSIRPTDTKLTSETVEVRLRGPGAATFGLFDAKGKAWATQRLRVSGPDNIEARTRVPLNLTTPKGDVSVVAVLIHRSNEHQQVSFGDQEAAAATAARFRQLKITKGATEKIERAVKVIAEQAGEPGVIFRPRTTIVAKRHR